MKGRKNVLILALCLSICFAAIAQNPQKDADSLLQQSRLTSTPDTTAILLALEAADLLSKTDRSPEALGIAHKKLQHAQQLKYSKGIVWAYTSMSVYYRYDNQLDSSLYFAKKALEFATGKSQAFDRADLFKKVGTLHFFQGETDSAVLYYRRALKTFEALNDSTQIFMLTVNMGAIMQREDKHNEAVRYFLDALALAESLGDKRGIAVCYNNLANTLDDISDYRGAIRYMQKVIEIRRSLGDSSGVGSAYLNMGAYYLNLKRLDTAEYCFKRALTLINPKLNADHYAETLGNLGTTYSRQGKYTAALDYMNQELRFRKENELDDNLASAYGNMANLYFRVGDYTNAIRYGERVVEAVKSSKELSVHKNAMRTLTESYLMLGQLVKAREAFISFTTLTDSLYRTETAGQVAEMQTKYETEQQQQENLLLKQKIETEELRHEKVLARRNAVIALASGLGLVGFFAFLWRTNVARLKEKKLELAHLQNLQHEKERISRDLHDNVGGQLSFLLHSIDDLNSPGTPNKQELAESINLAMRDVMGKLRETIWAIHQEEVSHTEFADKLKVFANSLFRHSKLQLQYEEHLPHHAVLPSMVALNLFRICQEILTNAFKHAGASVIKLTFISTGTGFELILSDNGKGMEGPIASGHGLRNIRERAAENKISLHFSSKANQGTTYKLSVV